MSDSRTPTPRSLRVGGLNRDDLLTALVSSGVHLNASAKTLLSDPAFEHGTPESIEIVECTLEDLGLSEGAVLSRIFATAQREGLSLCPPVTAPYLRLAMLDQQSAPDSEMSSGHAPSASITVASSSMRDDDDYPKGFYLRVVEGILWLRGYHTTDEHQWSPEDCFAFRL